MRRSEHNIDPDQKELYVSAEAQANLFNIRCIWVLIAFALSTVLLNELGVFRVPRQTMFLSAAVALLLLLVPVTVRFIHDKIRKEPVPAVEKRFFKYMLLTAVYVCIAQVCVTLSFHAILLMAVPPLMAAQYRYSRKINVIIFAATLTLVPVAVYGSFFFGLLDKNFIKNLTSAEAQVIANRVAQATPKRMGELFIHYVVPRALGILAIDILAVGITKRNERMLREQNRLTESLKEELLRRSEMQSRVIEDLAGVIETRDVGTGEHIVRTKIYVSIIARALQQYDEYKDVLTDTAIDQLINASPMHDIGKIAVSDTILLKPGRFTPEEFNEMKLHAEKGGEMIRNIFANFEDKDFLDKAYEIAMFHHEKWDGTGYPKGMKGEEIPLWARIMAIADVYDALVSKRVYKDPIPPEEAFRIIEEGAGSHFDPKIVHILKEVRDDFIAAAK